MNAMDRITPLILTFNEEANIGRLLKQLDWANEVIVIDSLSTDTTKEICEGHSNVRFVERPFDTHAQQWQFGLNQVNSDWVLALDADYFPSDEVLGEIAELAFDVNAYWVKFIYCIQGQPIYGSLYPPLQILYRKKHAHYLDDGHTQRVEIDGITATLKHAFLHDDRKPFSRWLLSQERYSELEAEKLLTTPTSELSFNSKLRRLGWLAPFIVPLLALIKGGILSKAGWAYSAERAIGEWILARKLWLRRMSKQRPK